MSTSLKVAEIIVRIIIIVVHILGIIGGGLLIQGLVSNTSSDTITSLAYGIGGAAIGFSGLVFIYEALMIVLSFVKKVNHPIRLFVDIVFSSVMICLCSMTTVTAIFLAVVLFLLILLVEGLGLLFPLPIVFGVLASTVFLVSALSSGVIFSKITSRSRAEANQPAPGNETTPTTSVAVQQQTSDPQALTGAGSDDPPTYYSTVGEGGFPQNVCATNPTTGVEEHYYSQADPPAIVGEGDFSQTAHTYPSTAGVEEHYYSQADPPATVGEGDSAHSNPTTGVEEPYYSQAQPGSNPPATVSEGDSPQIAHGYPTAGDGSDDSFYHQALTVNKVTIT